MELLLEEVYDRLLNRRRKQKMILELTNIDRTLKALKDIINKD
jgi:hypothetical protein